MGARRRPASRRRAESKPLEPDQRELRREATPGAPPLFELSAERRGGSPMSHAPIPLPPLGDNPSTGRQGTTPGSFAKRGAVGTPWTYSSPDAPGMPAPSEKTAWDFMPADWTCLDPRQPARPGAWRAPAGFIPVTQLEHARLGAITPQMRRVSEREGH